MPLRTLAGHSSSVDLQAPPPNTPAKITPAGEVGRRRSRNVELPAAASSPPSVLNTPPGGVENAPAAVSGPEASMQNADSGRVQSGIDRRPRAPLSVDLRTPPPTEPMYIVPASGRIAKMRATTPGVPDEITTRAVRSRRLRVPDVAGKRFASLSH